MAPPGLLADGVGFEPTRSVNPCRFSRPVPSTTRAPLRGYDNVLNINENSKSSRLVPTPIPGPKIAISKRIPNERPRARPPMFAFWFNSTPQARHGARRAGSEGLEAPRAFQPAGHDDDLRPRDPGWRCRNGVARPVEGGHGRVGACRSMPGSLALCQASF